MNYQFANHDNACRNEMYIYLLQEQSHKLILSGSRNRHNRIVRHNNFATLSSQILFYKFEVNYMRMMHSKKAVGGKQFFKFLESSAYNTFLSIRFVYSCIISIRFKSNNLLKISNFKTINTGSTILPFLRSSTFKFSTKVRV
jgi:hypothetical protein